MMRYVWYKFRQDLQQKRNNPLTKSSVVKLAMIFLILVLTLAYTLTYYFYKKRFSYWRIRGVPHLEPNIPFGDLEYPWKGTSPVQQYANFYKSFRERDSKHGGVFLLAKQTYFPIDPEYIRNMLIKDFHHFGSRGIYCNEKEQPIFTNLFFIEGDRWKRLRQKLTPTFTSGKMKTMFQTMLKCTEPLKENMEQMSAANEMIDVKETLGRFTTDVIGSCAFGIECDSFKNPNSDFRKYGKMVLSDSIYKFLKMIVAFNFQNFAQKIGIIILDRDVEDFFTRMATETYNYRVKNNIRRNDFMQLLIELTEKKDNSDEDVKPLTMNELTAQVFAFFVAGFDTSSASLTFCLFELASNINIQSKLREEIKTVLKGYNGEITYEALKDMEYMDQVINETLRKYPVVGIFIRKCTEAYKIPSTNIVIDKETSVLISILGLHRDPEYFPDPERFDPERFSNENKGKIIPGTYLPFGDGPRICIGLRFGIMQVKLCLIALLTDFEFSLNARTKVPLELDFGFVTTAKGGVWLNCKKVA